VKGDSLPEADTFARYCKKSRVFPSGAVAPDVFVLRRKPSGALDEESVSGGWLEKYCEGRDAQIAALRGAFARYLTYKPKDRFALLNVGATVQLVREKSADARVLRFLHDPDGDHEAHSGIYDTAEDEEHIVQLLARCVSETVFARP
jgi:hypothetical protein